MDPAPAFPQPRAFPTRVVAGSALALLLAATLATMDTSPEGQAQAATPFAASTDEANPPLAGDDAAAISSATALSRSPSQTGTVGRTGRSNATSSPSTSPSPRPGERSDDLPAAALQPEPPLPAARGWDFPEAFPRTSGTGRLSGGAFFWSDFLYDDHGARGTSVAPSETPFAFARGTYEYAAEAAARNGADIFRVAIGMDTHATYWRVDWNTLDDPGIPIAVFGVDLDRDLHTGTDAWPAGAGVRSPGVDYFLVVSAEGAWLVDSNGGRRPLGRPVVDTDARSFVTRVPRSALDVGGTSRIRLAAGVATDDGTAFSPVTPDQGAPPGGPAVYNVGFRAHDQEPVRVPDAAPPAAYNPWREYAQATALSTGDISAFAVDVDWKALAGDVTTPEPLVTGWSNRWYVSSIELGPGIVRDEGRGQDLRPNYLGRVQPFAVYLPSGYRPGDSVPLTWLLHSAYQNHNAFGAVTPRFVEAACERRNALCVTPLGRGHDGWFFDEAELDFWEVWGRLGDAFSIDPDRTVIAGFSMGGYGAYKIGLQYPHLFARAVAIGASPVCGRRIASGADVPEAPGRCTTDGNTTPLVRNATWLPFSILHGTTDELLPLTGTLDQVDEFDRHGLRYRFEHYLGQPHIPWYWQDRWGPAAEQMGSDRRVTAPRDFTLRWYPNLARPEWGMGVTRAYWLEHLQADDTSPGSVAEVRAESRALTGRDHAPVRRHDVSAREDAGVAAVSELTWEAGSLESVEAAVDLTLSNVAAATLPLARAGLPPGTAATIEVTTDTTTVLTLLGATGRVEIGDRAVGTAQGSAFPVTLPEGTHRIRVATVDPSSGT